MLHGHVSLCVCECVCTHMCVCVGVCVCVGECTPAPVQACVPLHVPVFADVLYSLSVWENVCVCARVCVSVSGLEKKQKTEVHSQYTNNESQYKLQLQQQEPQRLISTLFSVYFL